MAIIKPFKGYCPNSEIAGYVSSPPYDVMSSDEARDIVKNNPDSFLRVIKPEIDFQINKEPIGDTLHKHGSKNKNICLHNYHGITVTEKTILIIFGFTICFHDKISIPKSTDHHHQC